MDDEVIKDVAGVLSNLITQRNVQGKNAMTDGISINYYEKILDELSLIESGNEALRDELTILSKFIRNKIWPVSNSRRLYTMLHQLNSVYQIITEIVDWEFIPDVDELIAYIEHLANHYTYFAPSLSPTTFDNVIDKVLEFHYSKIILAQWDEVLADGNGMKTFMRVFDSVFTNAIEAHEDKFIYKFTDDVLLSRCVKKQFCDEDRFIPFPNKVHNRWNPPGKTYLYTAFKDQYIANTPKGLSGGQYICLMECRTTPGMDICFCDFKPITTGRVLDLSYNDIPLNSYRKMLSEEAERVANSSINRLLHDPKLLAHKNDKAYIQKMIEKDIQKDPFSDLVLIEGIAKQILKYICSCIYRKIEDENEAAKEKAYHSFHILAPYLESKGITGIIYPCTRIKGMPGKNVVLFNIADAKPIKGSIIQYHYEE